ncbi:VanZ family protein [Paenibacillus sp. WC2504]|uniref:VanZ family protein n=1 Tax=Paenibacillus sp. WC2504 TaxID=3461403 RepID=UPI004045FFCD
MIKKSNILKFLLYVLPILILLGLIYGLSSQTHQMQDLKPWIKKKISEKTINEHFLGTSINYGAETISLKTSSASSFVEFLVRKFAHLFIYGVLGGLIARLLHVFLRCGFGRNFLISVLLCTVYAVSDEFHQSFIKDRSSKPADVVLDAVGAIFGILLYLSVSHICQTVRKAKNSEI